MNPQAIKIYEILKDGQWHCPREWGYADGHCKRITDINEYLLSKGQKVDSEVCHCGHHISRLKKRRIVDLEQPKRNDRVDAWIAQFKKEPVKETNVLF